MDIDVHNITKDQQVQFSDLPEKTCATELEH